MNELDQLEQAIAALESQRAVLGDAVVDAALSSMREKLATLHPQPSAEQRKVVTVLFADLAEFTAMSERLDPEDVREIMNAYFTRWTACIEQFGGQVEKFIGDAVMAVFGLSVVQEDDPESAIRAALAMRQSLESLNAEFAAANRPQLSMRVGIHTGSVFISFLGERRGQDFVIVGDTVNLANRLQAVAPLGGVLISHDTYRHVRGIFEVQALAPINVKGKSEPVQVYLVVRAKPRAFSLQTHGIEGIETRLIGRETELKQLQDALYGVIEENRSQIVTVVGEAGIGKSRLVEEFDNWMELLPRLILYFKGRAHPSTQNLPYALIRDLFSFRFQIQDSDPPEVVQEKMEQGVRLAFRAPSVLPALDSKVTADQPTPGEVGEIRRAHFIGQLLGYELGVLPILASRQDPKQFHDLALAYLSDYFKAMTEINPVVLLLEDIHWADDHSLDVIGHLAATVSSQRMLLVCTARPSLFERRPSWGEAHIRFELRPLTRDDSRRLVDEILQKVEDAPGLRELVVDNAEGNPFFIEELIKMLIEDGVIRKDTSITKEDERWQVNGSRLAAVRVPPTLTGVLQARFDRLQPHEKTILQRASVMGRTFWEEAVDYLGRPQQQAPLPIMHGELATPGAISQALISLRTREMIYRRDESAFENTHEYLFKHALLRDVTYESVLKRERRIYHAHAARWLEQVTEHSHRADEYAALIADHYDLAREPEQAAIWYQRAGLHAAAQYANGEAVRCFTRSLELTPQKDSSRCYALLLERERVYDLQGNRPEQSRDLEALETLVDELEGEGLNVSDQRAEILLRRARCAELTSDFPTAIAANQQAIHLAYVTGSQAKEATGYLQWGQVLWRLADNGSAIAPLEKALEMAKAAHLPDVEAESLRSLGVISIHLGDYSAARDKFDQALQIYRRTGNRRGESSAINSLGLTATFAGDYAAARAYYEQAQKLNRETGDRRAESVEYNNMGTVAYSQADYAAALGYFNQSVHLSRQTGYRQGEALALNNLGLALLCTGEIGKTRGIITQALEIYREIGDRQGESQALTTYGLLLHRLGENEAARECCEQAENLAREVGSTVDEASALNNLGHTLVELGRLDEAATAYRTAIYLRKLMGQHDLAIESLAGLARAFLASSGLAGAVTGATPAGSIAQAREYVEEILSYLGLFESVPGQPPYTRLLYNTDEPLRIYLTCYHVLRALHDDRAAAVLRAAHRLLQDQAGRLGDSALQRSFLENVPANRQLMVEWEAVKKDDAF